MGCRGRQRWRCSHYHRREAEGELTTWKTDEDVGEVVRHGELVVAAAAADCCGRCCRQRAAGLRRLQRLLPRRRRDLSPSWECHEDGGVGDQRRRPQRHHPRDVAEEGSCAPPWPRRVPLVVAVEAADVDGFVRRAMRRRRRRGSWRRRPHHRRQSSAVARRRVWPRVFGCWRCQGEGGTAASPPPDWVSRRHQLEIVGLRSRREHSPARGSPMEVTMGRTSQAAWWPSSADCCCSSSGHP